ncbi:hypothetical protein RSAG8_00856, partial [Rhizoctonia solani AG-8 WAC10335]
MAPRLGGLLSASSDHRHFGRLESTFRTDTHRYLSRSFLSV